MSQLTGTQWTAVKECAVDTSMEGLTFQIKSFWKLSPKSLHHPVPSGREASGQAECGPQAGLHQARQLGELCALTSAQKA